MDIRRITFAKTRRCRHRDGLFIVWHFTADLRLPLLKNIRKRQTESAVVQKVSAAPTRWVVPRQGSARATTIEALEKAKVTSTLLTIEAAAHGFNAKQNEVECSGKHLSK